MAPACASSFFLIYGISLNSRFRTYLNFRPYGVIFELFFPLWGSDIPLAGDLGDLQSLGKGELCYELFEHLRRARKLLKGPPEHQQLTANLGFSVHFVQKLLVVLELHNLPHQRGYVP